MKLKRSLLAMTVLSGLAATASAQTTVIDIVGSTAGRTAVYNRILGMITKTSSAASGSSLEGSNQAIIHGTYQSGSVIIRLNFTGSAAGVNQVTNQVQTPFFATSVGTTGDTLSVPFSGGNLANSAPEIGYSDVFQSTTAFTNPPLAQEDEVAVIPFKFFKTQDGAATLTNITSQQVRNLYGSLGSAPLSVFTGVSTDTQQVYATGRDASSGTRITAFAETATPQGAVSQYQPTTTATNGTGSVTALGGTTTGGFSSGSNVANVLNSTFAGGTIVGYLGASDWPATPPVATDGQPLSFNGVAYSEQAVYEGSYSFWGYLHQFHQNLSGTSLNFYEDLRDALVANPGNGVLPLANMKVARDGDGFSVYPLSP